MVEAADVDGVTRLYAFTPLRGAPGDSVYMSVGIPIAVAYADANQTLARNLTGLGLVAVLALAAAWVSSELFLLRQVKALVHATQRLAAGDLSAHTGVPYGPGELGQLARVFDQMAEALEQHEAERQRAEAALRESEERYRSLFDGVPVGLYQTTPAGQFVDANPAMVEMLGYPNRETLLTVNATSVYIDPKERRRWQVLVEQEEVVRDFEARKRRYDGTVILVRDSARAIRDAAGRVLYYEGYEEDITERKRVEEALYEQAQILSSIQDTIVIISPEMKTIYANQTAKDLFGDRPEMFTEPCYRFFKRRDNVCEDCPVLEVFKDEKPHKAILKSYDKDGREIWRYNTAFPFYDQDGRLIAGIEIVTDYTAQKMAEEALRASESEKALILSSVAELVAHQDNELRLVWANRVAGESAGLSADELVGRHCYEIWQQRSEPCIGCPVVEALETGEPHEAEMTTPDGRVWFIRGYPARGENGDVIGAVEVTQEITERNRAEKQIQRQLQRLHAMREIDMAITSSVDRSVTLNIVLDQVTSQLGVDAADVLLLDPHTQTLEYATGRGFRSAALQHTHLRLGEGYAGRAALQRNIINIPNLAEAKDSFRHSPLLPDEQFIAYYGVPLIAKGQVKGVLEIFHRAPLDPDREWLDFLEALAMQAAITIDNTELFSNLQRANAELTLAYDTTLEGWARALELRDVETEGHTQRTTDMTLRLAQAVGMSNADASAGPSTGLRTGLSTSLVHVRRGALLHDIGKMGVADTILLKPGPLTEEEWDIMRQHPVYAYEMLSPITYLRPALDIPYCHHERWDGTGYPRGLKGEQIPLAARIFAVVDVWDALLSERPYRPAWSEEEAIEYIREQAGKHFDPQVVEVFLRVIGNESTRQQGNTGMR
jgi:PAS domain S-box-containing protein